MLIHYSKLNIGIGKAYVISMMNMEDPSLPACPVAIGAAVDIQESAQTPAPNVRVWLVDNDDQLRALVAEVLGQQDGIECVRHFSSPDALLSLLASKPGPDVILLDVQMGERNGLDAVRPIKSLARSTRVMMYTTCSDREWRERALNDGASDYLLKSYAMETVAARIRSAAKDPIFTSYSRRRVSHSAAGSRPSHSAGSSTAPSAHLLGRTLKKLRALWN